MVTLHTGTDVVATRPAATTDLLALRETAWRVRCHVVRTVHRAGAGHLGASLSAADILTALHFSTMHIDPARPEWEERDRFILSKGHASIGLYAVLAERGYFPLEELDTFDEADSRLQGHPDMLLTPGIDMSTGSLGQGLSTGIGFALGARLLGRDYHTFVIMGDGESQEGQVWEAAALAVRYGIEGLTAILDYNRLQQYGWRRAGGGEYDRMPPDIDPCAKWRAFGWRVVEVNGHDMGALVPVLQEARSAGRGPTIVIAHTVKGKGVSFMENNYRWHASPLTDLELAAAMSELGASEPAREVQHG